MNLQQPLPTIPIPLNPNDEEVYLDLQGVFGRVYEDARYGIRLNYHQPPPAPALSAQEQEWLKTLLIPDNS
ncbi:DUF4058 family protein [Halomicronema hongdechloris]|uniref:DUF4058 family protein n=1 Tax=Halomicronema hongdechloris TaxID=1209493 RepID=UPI0009D2B75B